MLIQRRPRKGTKKFKPRPPSGSRNRERDRRSPDFSRDYSRDHSRMGDFSDSDDSDISSVSQSRRLQRRMRSPKQSLKTVRLSELKKTLRHKLDVMFQVSYCDLIASYIFLCDVRKLNY